MAPVAQARDISLDDLQNRFNLQAASDSRFFDEWQKEIPESSAFEKAQLKRIQSNYYHLAGRKSFSEEAVKMVVLSPLLDLAEFYQAPFSLSTEESISITSEDEGLIVEGSIDVLVARQQFWVLVIESKSTRFDVLSALPQALAYMLDAPDSETPVYGLLINGREFVFVKVVQQPERTYARSYALSIERDDELSQILGILKIIRQKVSSSPGNA